MNAIKKITALSTVFFGGYTFTALGKIPCKNGTLPRFRLFSESKPHPTEDDENETAVYGTNSGDKFNLISCSYLRKSKIPISLKNVKAQSYTPCSRCNPPQ
ncbi:MAG TPA: hypothetical protein PLV00_07945 [Caldisericia bacterium]|nr:hypothetical protein [Caldisericia bacterium]